MEEGINDFNLDDKVPGSGVPYLDKTFLEVLIDMAVDGQRLALPVRSNLYVGASVIALPPDRTSPMTFDFYNAGNVEMLWQNSSHAEKNAIMGAVARNHKKILAVCIAAERKLFTPCGGCMDVIFEFGGKDCHVIHYNPSTKAISRFTARQIMPYYPTKD
jgi:cytidine deaminase